MKPFLSLLKIKYNRSIIDRSICNQSLHFAELSGCNSSARETVIKKFNFKSLYTGMLPLLVLAHAMHHLLTTLLIPLMPMIRNEFLFDYTQSGLLLSVFNLTYGIGQLPSGWIADHIGRRIMITIGIVGVAISGLFIGLSHTYIMLVIFLALMGITGGGYHPSASPVVAATVKPEHRGSALGIHLIGGSTSHFLAPLLGVAIATALGIPTSTTNRLPLVIPVYSRFRCSIM